LNRRLFGKLGFAPIGGLKVIWGHLFFQKPGRGFWEGPGAFREKLLPYRRRGENFLPLGVEGLPLEGIHVGPKTSKGVSPKGFFPNTLSQEVKSPYRRVI